MLAHDVPTAIDVGPKRISVVLVDDLGDDNYGEYGAWLSHIRVARGHCSDLEMANTLIHEILHVGFDQYRLGDHLPDDGVKETREETIVSAMANTVTEVLRRNPDLMKYLLLALGYEVTES